MDIKYKLNCRMNVNIVITDFWLTIARGASNIMNFATKKAEIRVRRNLQIAQLMEKENYPLSFQAQLNGLTKESGQQ